MSNKTVAQRIAIRKSIEAKAAREAEALVAEKRAKRNAYFARKAVFAKRAAVASA